jgi:hypothetical protein
MGRRRESHRHHRELTPEMAFDLAGWGNPAFASEEERRAAWAEHRDELLARRGGLPGTRPEAYWRYTVGAPRDEDFLVPARDPDALRVDHDAAWEAQIRFLAERGELRDDEVQALADDVAEKATWTEEAQERARARLDAALEGLAARQQDQRQEEKNE